MAYEEVEPQVWKPENEGDFVEGFLVDVKSDIGPNKSKLYTIEKPDNKFESVWGSKVLDERMSLISIGQKVRITYNGLGEAKSGANPPKLFKVEVDREATKESSENSESSSE